MTSVGDSLTNHRAGTCCQVVEPALFAECLLSHERWVRCNRPEDNLLGIRRMPHGETLFVNACRFQRWLLRHG